MTKAIYSIYKATNLINGKSYIGFTNNFQKRKKQHIREAKNGSNASPKFYRSIRKYGIKNFKWEILYQSPTEDTTLKIIEPFYSNIYNSLKNGLNTTPCGGKPPSFKGKKLSQSAKNKLRQANLGKKHSKESKQKMSLAHKGKSLSSEHKKNISKSLKENPYWLNKHHTKASIIKISNNKKEFYKTHKQHNQKTYKIISPNNDIIITNNINEYALKNNIKASTLRKCARNNSITRTGYKVIEIQD